MSPQLFTPQEYASLEREYRKLRRAALATFTVVVATLLQLGLLLLVLAVEFHLFYAVFDRLKGPEVPGESSGSSVFLLALTGALACVGFHIRAKSAEKALVVRFMKRCVDVLIPVYAIGAGLAVASTVYFDGADAVLRATKLPADLFDGSVGQSSSWFDLVMGYAPALFSVACGVVVLVNLNIVHDLATRVWSNAESIRDRWLDAFEARRAIIVTRTCQRDHAHAQREYEALKGLDQRAEELRLAHACHAAIGDAISPYEKFLLDQKLICGNGSSFEPLRVNVNVAELEKQVERLRNISVKSIHAAMRGDKN